MNGHSFDHDDPTLEPPKPVWLTREAVLETYGFDPAPYITRATPTLKTKLRVGGRVTCSGIGYEHLYLKDSVEAHPRAKKAVTP